MSRKDILFYTKYSRKGASSRLRTLQYLDELGDKIPSYDVYPLFTDSYLELLYSKRQIPKLLILNRYFLRIIHVIFSSSRYKKIYIEKELLPYFPPILEYFLKNKYVVDYDDAIFHNYDRHTSWIIRKLLGKKIANVMKYAKVVVVGNEYLSEYASQASAKNIKLIPTVVSESRYRATKFSFKKELVLGWIGTPNTQKYIVDLFPIFEKLSLNYSFELHLIGVNEDKLPNYNFNLKVINWAESTEVESLSKIDIGLMPLPDGPFENGKCGYKLIQYMALSKPVIASPVGVNKQIVDHGENGYLATSNEEWYQYISELLVDENKIKSFGEKSKDKFLKSYSLESCTDLFLKVLSE